MFLGDGMSIETLTAARILKGQREGGLGEDAKLAVDGLPHVGLAKVTRKRKCEKNLTFTLDCYVSYQNPPHNYVLYRHTFKSIHTKCPTINYNKPNKKVSPPPLIKMS